MLSAVGDFRRLSALRRTKGANAPGHSIVPVAGAYTSVRSARQSSTRDIVIRLSVAIDKEWDVDLDIPYYMEPKPLKGKLKNRWT